GESKHYGGSAFSFHHHHVVAGWGAGHCVQTEYSGRRRYPALLLERYRRHASFLGHTELVDGNHQWHPWRHRNGKVYAAGVRVPNDSSDIHTSAFHHDQRQLIGEQFRA